MGIQSDELTSQLLLKDFVRVRVRCSAVPSQSVGMLLALARCLAEHRGCAGEWFQGLMFYSSSLDLLLGTNLFSANAVKADLRLLGLNNQGEGVEVGHLLLGAGNSRSKVTRWEMISRPIFELASLRSWKQNTKV